MREALKIYGGGEDIAPTEDDARTAAEIFRRELLELEKLFAGHDLSPFRDSGLAPAERYRHLRGMVEFILASPEMLKIESDGGKKVEAVIFRTYFTRKVSRMRRAYEICYPAGELGGEEATLAQCFMAAAGMIRKQNGTSDVDADVMNAKVAEMVEEALRYSKVENVFDVGNGEDIFSPDFMESLNDIHMPATKLELLIRLLKKAIAEYSLTNKIAARKFSVMLDETIRQYHERRESLSAEESAKVRDEASLRIIEEITRRAVAILRGLHNDRESFRKVGLTFEEKAFYDILIYLRDKYSFEYGEDVRDSENIPVNELCKLLARKIKAVIDGTSSQSEWLDNQIVRDKMKFAVKVCLVKNGYPPQYSPDVFRQIMEQAENFKMNSQQ